MSQAYALTRIAGGPRKRFVARARCRPHEGALGASTGCPGVRQGEVSPACPDQNRFMKPIVTPEGRISTEMGTSCRLAQ